MKLITPLAMLEVANVELRGGVSRPARMLGYAGFSYNEEVNMDSDNEDYIREQFEQFILPKREGFTVNGTELLKNNVGVYYMPEIQMQWFSWKHAWKIALQDAQGA